LKKLGLNTPETIEDFYNVLVKFKQAGMKPPWAPYQGQEMQLASSWGVHIHPALLANSFYAYNGKVQYEWINPRLKDFYAWANKCYTEGLMDKEFAKQSWDTMTTKVANGDVGFMDIQVGCAWSFNPIASKTVNATYVACPPFKGPNGDRFIIKNYSSGAPAGYVVTKECKVPEIATAFLSWCLLSDDYFNLMYWGVEGKTYNIVNGKKVRPDGYKGDDLGKVFPQNALPFNQFFPQLSEVWPSGGTDDVAKSDATVQPFFIDPYPANMLTEEEMSVWAKKMTDIKTYVEENKQKFITGDRPISEWDQYVEGVKSLGIDDVLKIEQARYDRYLKIIK
ncbi:MAG: extracellular solute-binding protein, partial [Clostridiales bacterium]|nr:extracellular solute-binding protein [Clostridiales bacterium]